ncbi:MAG: polysaccharide biosynthesis tyrosine autokinase [Verrucomicrobiota bacterium]
MPNNEHTLVPYQPGHPMVPGPPMPQLGGPSPQPPGGPLPIIDFEQLTAMFRRQRWRILLVTVAGLLAGIVYLMFCGKTYETSARLEISAESPRASKFEGVTQSAVKGVEDLNTVEQNLTSTDILAKVIEINNLGEHPGFVSPRPNGKPYLKEELLKVMKSSSNVTLERGTRLVKVTFKCGDPALAKQVVDSYIEVFKESQKNRIENITAEAREALARDVQNWGEKLRRSQEALQIYAEDQKNLSLDDNIIGDKLKALSDQLFATQTRKMQLAADIEKLRGAGNDVSEILQISSVAQIPEVRELRVKISDAEAEFGSIKKRYLYKHPAYITADTRLVELKKSLRETAVSGLSALRRDLDATQEEERKLKQALEGQKDLSSNRRKAAVKYGNLQREVSINQTTYDSLVQRLQELEVTLGLFSHSVHQIEEAIIPSQPIWPVPGLVLPVALVGSCVCGFCLALLIELIDRRLHNLDDVQQMIQIPCLAALPNNKIRKLSERLIVHREPHSVASEAVRSLRASLSFLGDRPEPRTILITSSVDKEGKSFVSINLAAAYAMQGQRTLLIEGDLRNPSLAHSFPQAAAKQGLTSFLKGKCTVDRICYPTLVDNLFVIPCGEICPNPAELLSTSFMAELMAQSMQYFDRVVIDSAPVSLVSDSLLLSRYAEAICLVVKAKSTSRKAVSKSMQILQRSGKPPVGFILNHAPPENLAHSYSAMNSTALKGLQTRLPGRTPTKVAKGAVKETKVSKATSKAAKAATL